MSCPKCKSDEWKSASFVYKSGTLDVSLKTSTAGLGSSGIGVSGGVDSSRTSGMQQSRLAIESAPPEMPQNDEGGAYWLLMIFLAIFFGVNSAGIVGWLIIIVAFGLWFGDKGLDAYFAEAYQKRIEEYNKKVDLWEATRVCQRCGQVYYTEDFVGSYEKEYDEDAIQELNSIETAIKVKITHLRCQIGDIWLSIGLVFVVVVVLF